MSSIYNEGDRRGICPAKEVSMSDFENQARQNGLCMKHWRGERMRLLAFDVEKPEPDFVGFAIEVKNPNANKFTALRNRIAFSYPNSVEKAVTGARQYSSLEAPFQKFRWLHFPKDPKPGLYTYRGTKMHMRPDGTLVRGDFIELP